MSASHAEPPVLMPILSRGKHRNPRKGACFMELASYLAGERWSDHPRCTHPLLAALARLVNDYTSDAGRPRLAELIPRVIGLTSDDPRVDVRIALGCAREALPLVSAERQRVMAVAVLASERALDRLDRRPAPSLGARSRWALAQVPDASHWAYDFGARAGMSSRGLPRHAAEAILRCAVQGIAEACVPHPDDLLREMLVGAIGDLAAASEQEAAQRPSDFPTAWASACQLTGAR